jgi:eukaryotic-like serine/threonine-protein kinase
VVESADTLAMRSVGDAPAASTRLRGRRGAGAAGTVVLDRYRLIEPLGAGGFGVVWLAHDERLDREVAVKRIQAPEGSTTPSGRLSARVRREAKAAARLSHPAIVAIYEAEAGEGALYLVSELVRGRTLADLEHDGELSDLDVVAVGVAMCDALSHAHARGVIHRDIKPANVMVPDPDEQDGVPVAAKLTDFGIAHLIGDDALTHTGDVMGTLAYMAPEQAEGRRVGPSADLYSLAVLLYEAFSGVNPLRGGRLSPRGRPERLPSLRRMRRDLPAPLCRAIDVAVSPRPDERGTVKELRAALVGSADSVDDVAGTIVGAPLESLVSRRPARSFSVGARTSAAVCAAALAGLVLWRLAPAGGPAPLAGGIATGVAVALLPRAGWLVAATALVAWLAAAGLAGVALLTACALIVTPLAMPALPAAWSVPVLAPLLGLIGLAGAFPALAGRTRSAVARAALGAAGVWWVLLAEPALSTRLLAGGPAESVPRSGWEGDIGRAASDVLSPVIGGGMLTLALVWAAAAVVLPWLVRGFSLRMDALAGALWATGLAVATIAVVRGAVPDPPGALTRETIGAALLALLLALAGRRRPDSL